MKRILAIVALVALTACGSEAATSSTDGSAPAKPRKPKAPTIEFDYADVTMKCDGHGHRIYLAQSEGTDLAIAVVNDDNC